MFNTFVVILVTLGVLTCNAQRCDNNQLRRCQDDINNYSSRRRPDCRQLIDSFGCFLEQTVNCLREEEREGNGQIIRKARDDIKRDCSSQSEWDRKQCYGGDLERCDEMLPRRIVNADRDTCRKYDSLVNCARDHLSKSCNRDDETLFQIYLYDIAKDLTWQCPSSLSTSTSSGRQDYNTSNGTSFVGEICCKKEHCDRNRLFNCIEEVRKKVDGRDRQSYTPNSDQECRHFLNSFNCLWWHNYKCANQFEKEKTLLQRAKNHIRTICDIDGDIQRSDCFRKSEIVDCENHLRSETDSSSHVTCREYKLYFECVDRFISRGYCRQQDELLLGYHIVEKTGNSVFECSYDDDRPSSFTDRPGTMQGHENCERDVRQNKYTCERRFHETEDIARKTSDGRERNVKSCCSALEFRECLRKLTRERCYRENSDVVDSIMDTAIRNRITRTCQDIDYSTTCSATRAFCNVFVLAIAIILFQSIFG